MIEPLKVKEWKRYNDMPAQWKGNVEDGRMFYIRYRGGDLMVHLSNVKTTNVMMVIGKNIILDKGMGDWLDMQMDDKTMMNAVNEVLDFEGGEQ